MKKILFLFFFCSFLPSLAHAAVSITEIAWMGTSESQYGEWFELYNSGTDSVSLSGWKLLDGEGTIIFTFSKEIAAEGYLVVERTTASSSDPLPGISDESGSFGGSGFANTGEHLVLKDSTGGTIEDLDFVTGWPAGDSTTKETMQWNGNEWVTAVATPGAQTQSNIDTTHDEETDTASSGDDIDPIPAVSPNKPAVVFTFPGVVYSGVPYNFIAEPVLEYNFHVQTGVFYWNMGDGTVFTQKELSPISHLYKYPGTYTVWFSYFNRAGDSVPILTGSNTVEVVEPQIAITLTDHNSALKLENKSSKIVDVSGWSVGFPDKNVLFPPMTLVAPHATVIIPLSVFGVQTETAVTLRSPGAQVVSASGNAVPAPNTVVRTVASRNSLIASAAPISTEENTPLATVVAKDTVSQSQKRNHTSTIVYGVVVAIVIALFILLERTMAREE